LFKAFFKDSAIYYIPTLVSRALSLILLPLYTRVLTIEDYGSFDLLMVFASIINLTIALEISQGVARFYLSEKNSNRKIIFASTAFWFTFACYFIFAIIMWFSSGQLANFIMGQPKMELAFQIGIGYIFINGIFYFIQNQLRYEFRARDSAIVNVTMITTTAFISVYLTIFLSWDLIGLLAGMTSGTIIATILGLWNLKKSFSFTFNFRYLKKMLYYSIPLVISGFAVWMTTYIDRIMINHFLTIKEVGLYGVGFRLSSIILLIISGIELSLSPLIYKYYHKSDTPRVLDQIFRLVIFFSLIFFLFLTLFSLDILKIMTTPEYYDASTMIVFLVPALLLRSLYIFSPGINIAKKTYLTIWINIMGGLLNILLNYFFIPMFGLIGAGIATMLSYLCIFTAYMYLSLQFYYIPYQWKKILVSTLIAAIIVLFFQLYQFSNTLRTYLVIFTIVVFGILMIKIKLVSFRKAFKLFA
jgi:O-antigen/teichoic acid export membrane protein